MASTPLGGTQAPPREARSVWDGVFTEAQARRGRGFYLEHCASCHGANLQGGEYRALQGDEYRALQGDRFWVAWQETTVDYLLRKISTTMPHSEDGSLKGTLGAHTYVDIIAHILSTNGFPAGATELTEASSVGIRIVQKDGPGELPAGSFVHVVGCLTRGSDGNWKLLQGSRPARVVDGRDPDIKAPLGDREYALMFVLTRLDKSVGHRVSVQASLMGDGGAQGLNVTAIRSVSDTCE
jgi:quinoprotein glucose dehydrogenase